MARVFIPAQLTALTDGAAELDIFGQTAGEIVAELMVRYPRLQSQMLQPGGALRSGIAIAIDGEIAVDGLRERVPPGAEVHFVMAIKGGS